jgi:hypothetical protein
MGATLHDIETARGIAYYSHCDRGDRFGKPPIEHGDTAPASLRDVGRRRSARRRRRRGRRSLRPMNSAGHRTAQEARGAQHGVAGGGGRIQRRAGRGSA